MAKNTKTPGSVLNALLKKYNLNYNRLAKSIGLSSAMVRLIARDENPVSAAVAFRLAAFFKQKPEFWLSLQTDYDLAKTAADKKLAKELKDIPTVDKATFERKKKAKSSKAAKPKKAAAKAKKPAAKKAAPKKTAKAKPAVKKATPKKSAVKTAAPKPVVKPATVEKPTAPVVKPATPQQPAQPAQPTPSSPPPANDTPSNESKI